MNLRSLDAQAVAIDVAEVRGPFHVVAVKASGVRAIVVNCVTLETLAPAGTTPVPFSLTGSSSVAGSAFQLSFTNLSGLVALEVQSLATNCEDIVADPRTNQQ